MLDVEERKVKIQDATLKAPEDVRERVDEALEQGREAVISAYEAGKEAFQRERERLTTSSN